MTWDKTKWVSYSGGGGDRGGGGGGGGCGKEYQFKIERYMRKWVTESGKALVEDRR